LELPASLWPQPADLQLASDMAALFDASPLILTDRLANSLYLNAAAEELFGERAEALVNRLSFSLLGFGNREKVPGGLEEALLGRGAPWRGVVQVQAADGPLARFAEASAIRRGDLLVCGVIRLSFANQALP